MVVTASELRLQFFDYLFEKEEGYLCIAYADPNYKQTGWKQRFFDWPAQRDEIGKFISKRIDSHHIYFGVNLLETKERKKQYVKSGNRVWSDLDAVVPTQVEPIPQVIIESSPGRYQAIWRLEETISIDRAEEFSKRLAYKYVGEGADKGCWDRTRVLRVPFSNNYKYPNAPQVELHTALETLIPVAVFEALEDVVLTSEEAEWEETLPPFEDVPEADAVIYKYLPSLQRTAFAELFSIVPNEEDDWSRRLWRLINICYECGMEELEVFSVALASKCNKYVRDNRPMRYLWRDVRKAGIAQKDFAIKVGEWNLLAMPTLVEEAQIDEETIINEYRSWGALSTDAPVHYHELACFVLLSALMSQGLRLETSYGSMVPNLWGLVLGDSTLTRKSTATDYVTEFLADIDPDIVLATDGSAEGLLTGLAERPNRVSMFYRDEVTGFIDSINRKDYLAGMPEIMTKLYDVPRFFTRRLRKEKIEITRPIFIFFGGGIRDKFMSTITEEHVLSGFMPRFLIVCGDADVNALRPTGPPTRQHSEARAKLLSKFSDLYEIYSRMEEVQVLGQGISTEVVIEASLDEKAWDRYAAIEIKMVEVAHSSPVASVALPTFERLSRSLLKMAVLLAASRSVPENNSIRVTEQDIIHAAYYIQDWGRYSVDLVINSGRSKSERVLNKVIDYIRRHPGVHRGQIMRIYGFDKRMMDDIQGTLVDRGQLRVIREGKGVVYHAYEE